MSSESSGIPSDSLWRNLPPVKWLLVALALLIAVMLLFTQSLDFTFTDGRTTEYRLTTDNMRQIGIGLLEFEMEFGSYPNDSTIALVRERYPESKIPLGTSSSNDYFHQLLAAGFMEATSCFHDFGLTTYKPPEAHDAELPLPPGTCAFAYIITDGKPFWPDTPHVVYPLIRDKFVFDKKLCKLGGGKAYILRADNSVQAHPIDSSGRMIIDGRDLFDPAQPHWHGRSFRVAWPE